VKRMTDPSLPPTAICVPSALRARRTISVLSTTHSRNFVQVPTMPTIQPVEHRAAISKFIAPNVLFYFRYAALATVITGLLLAWMLGYIVQALTLRPGFVMIGIGMWMALIMAFNVWFIIWPNQQKILGLVEATAEQKAAAAKPALYASRFNTMFSIGMLYCMVAQQNAPV